MKTYNIAVAGATGLVGREMISMLEKRNFPVGNLRLLASSRSLGKKMKFKGQEIEVEELTKDSFSKGDTQIALFSAGGGTSKEFAPYAAENGVFVVDNSSAWRMDDNSPLIVPEVNEDALAKDKKIIANPNCSTIQMVVALAPIHKAAKIKRIVVSTFQSVSGAGIKAVNELEQQVKDISEGKTPKPSKFPHQIAYNCIPHIDVFLENGYTKEEMKMVNETKKIMGDDSIQVTATCVRVPVFRAHSESVNIETEKHLSAKEAMGLLGNAPGIVVVDDVSKLEYPLAVNAAYKEETFVGRIREDDTVANGLNMWIVSDNLLKGAALNAVQIAESLVKREFV